VSQNSKRTSHLVESLRAHISSLRTPGKECSHRSEIREVSPSAAGCEDCLKTGDSWVHLRMCLICGYVGCCNDSKNRHSARHFHATRHPIMRSIEPGEDWMYCYIDEARLS
jgi:uncharacterized UBP type Zn finger protein